MSASQRGPFGPPQYPYQHPGLPQATTTGTSMGPASASAYPPANSAGSSKDKGDYMQTYNAFLLRGMQDQLASQLVSDTSVNTSGGGLASTRLPNGTQSTETDLTRYPAPPSTWAATPGLLMPNHLPRVTRSTDGDRTWMPVARVLSDLPSATHELNEAQILPNGNHFQPWIEACSFSSGAGLECAAKEPFAWLDPLTGLTMSRDMMWAATRLEDDDVRMGLEMLTGIPIPPRMGLCVGSEVVAPDGMGLA